MHAQNNMYNNNVHSIAIISVANYKQSAANQLVNNKSAKKLEI